MNASNRRPESAGGASTRRWFWYLLVFTIVSLVEPYFANADSRVHSSKVKTFHEVDGRLQPTTEKIWIDGRTAAELNRGLYLSMGLFMVLVEVLAFTTKRLLSRRWVLPHADRLPQ
jgi:hypothetical protein